MMDRAHYLRGDGRDGNGRGNRYVGAAVFLRRFDVKGIAKSP